jgi:hypothetical protein
MHPADVVGVSDLPAKTCISYFIGRFSLIFSRPIPSFVNIHSSPILQVVRAIVFAIIFTVIFIIACAIIFTTLFAAISSIGGNIDISLGAAAILFGSLRGTTVVVT